MIRPPAWDADGWRFERVVSFGMPCPLALMPYLLRAAGQWHARWCDRPGCELVIGGNEIGDHQLNHRWPTQARGEDSGS